MDWIRFKHLWIGSSVFVVLALLGSFFISGIHYRSEITDYFPKDHPQLLAFKQLEQSAGFQQSLVVLLKSAQPGVAQQPGDYRAKSFLSQQQLFGLYRLVKNLQQEPDIARIQSLLSTAITDSEQDMMSMYRWLSKGQTQIGGEVIAQLADVGIASSLLSKDAQVTSLYLYFPDQAAVGAAYPRIQALLTKEFVEPGFGTFELLGPVEIKQALQRAMMHDAFSLMPLVLVIGLAVLWYFAGSLWLVVSGGLSIAVALWLTADIAGLLGFTLNQTSALAFCIVFIIALADVIHLLISFVHQPASLSPQGAMLRSLQLNLSCLFLTTLTTTIGFLSLNFSSSPVFATFGNLAAIGIGCAFLTAITITPVMATLVKVSVRGRDTDLLQRFVDWINGLCESIRPAYILGFYAITLLLTCGLLFNQYHNDPLEYFEENSGVQRALDIFEDDFSVHSSISIQLDAGVKEGVFATDYLRALYRFQQWLAADPRVSSQTSYLDVLAQLKRQLHENDLRWLTTFMTPAEASDLWNLYQMAAPENTPESLGLDSQFRRSLISLGLPYLSSGELVKLEADIHQWFAQAFPDFQVQVTGHSMLFASLGKELTRNMFIGGLVSAVIISLLLGVFLGNIRLGMLSLIPNVLPGALVFGIWGLIEGRISIAAAGTLSISLGIVVDDSIHILKRYLGFRRTGIAPRQSIARTLKQVGSALVLTTLVLSIGMFILTLSVFQPNQETALLMGSIIFTALLYDLVLLPHLLVLFDHWLFPDLPVADKISQESTSLARTTG